MCALLWRRPSGWIFRPVGPLGGACLSTPLLRWPASLPRSWVAACLGRCAMRSKKAHRCQTMPEPLTYSSAATRNCSLCRLTKLEKLFLGAAVRRAGNCGKSSSWARNAAGARSDRARAHHSGHERQRLLHLTVASDKGRSQISTQYPPPACFGAWCWHFNGRDDTRQSASGGRRCAAPCLEPALADARPKSLDRPICALPPMEAHLWSISMTRLRSGVSRNAIALPTDQHKVRKSIRSSRRCSNPKGRSNGTGNVVNSFYASSQFHPPARQRLVCDVTGRARPCPTVLKSFPENALRRTAFVRWRTPTQSSVMFSIEEVAIPATVARSAGLVNARCFPTFPSAPINSCATDNQPPEDVPATI